MKQALEALQFHNLGREHVPQKSGEAIAALRLAIEQAERVKRAEEVFAAASDEMKSEQAEWQEPVAHLWQHSETGRTRIVMPDQIVTADADWFVVGPLYLGAAPPQCEPLTEETLYAMAEVAWRAGWAACRDAEFIGEEAEDEAWGYQGATVVQDIERKHGIGGTHD